MLSAEQIEASSPHMLEKLLIVAVLDHPSDAEIKKAKRQERFQRRSKTEFTEEEDEKEAHLSLLGSLLAFRASLSNDSVRRWRGLDLDKVELDRELNMFENENENVNEDHDTETIPSFGCGSDRFVINRPPIVMAASQSSTDACRLLLEHGADPNSCCTRTRRTALYCGCLQNDNAGLIRLMLFHGASVVCSRMDETEAKFRQTRQVNEGQRIMERLKRKIMKAEEESDGDGESDGDATESAKRELRRLERVWKLREMNEWNTTRTRTATATAVQQNSSNTAVDVVCVDAALKFLESPDYSNGILFGRF